MLVLLSTGATLLVVCFFFGVSLFFFSSFGRFFVARRSRHFCARRSRHFCADLALGNPGALLGQSPTIFRSGSGVVRSSAATNTIPLLEEIPLRFFSLPLKA